MALCSNADCGVITTPSPDEVQPDGGLESYLLGPVPAKRYLKPWVRLYFKASRWGYRWFPHHESCPSCGGEFTVQLGLPPLVERQNDPYQVVLCLTCGATSIAWWLTGERVILAISGEEWHEPPTAILILKRALEERADGPSGGYEWSFR